MKINIPSVIEVDIKTVSVHVKVCDSGNYYFKDVDGKIIVTKEGDYVPSLFPGEHYGDYLILDIDIESGLILNWKKPSIEKLIESFSKSN